MENLFLISKLKRISKTIYLYIFPPPFFLYIPFLYHFILFFAFHPSIYLIIKFDVFKKEWVFIIMMSIIISASDYRYYYYGL
jgi:hypothetical protein